MGHIEKTPAGTYKARWREAGHERAKTFRLKADARAHLDAVTRREVNPSTRITVAQWADTWLATAHNLGQGGRDTYRRDLDRHILPAIGHHRLNLLDPTTIDRYLADKLAVGVAPSTVHRHYRTIRRLCAVAVAKGVLARNPCDAVTPPKVPHVEMRFLTADQVEALASAITPRYRTWVLVAAWGGLRWSEAVGLRRRDVTGARLTIEGQLIRRDDGQWHRDPPKTRAGRRTVTLPASVGDELAGHLEVWAAPGLDGLVWPNQGGRPMNGPSFRGNIWLPAVRRAGLEEGLRPHDLRHTAVALAIAAGAHPKAIQVRMGHASITQTLDRYGHLFTDVDEDVAAGLDGLRRPA